MHMASHKQYVASTNKLFHTPHHIHVQLACSSGVAKGGPGWARAHPNFHKRAAPARFVISNKRQVVHTLVVRYYRCKSAVDIGISSMITSRDPNNFVGFYLTHSIT